MKRYVRGQFGRFLSMVLMALLLVPGMLLPWASAATAATNGRKDIVVLPLLVTAKHPPFDVAERVVTQLLVDISHKQGVQVDELLSNSPMLTRAKAQLEEKDRDQLMDRYNEAIDPNTETQTRVAAVGFLVRALGVDACVFGTLDQYEYVDDPDPHQSLIHISATKVTLDKDGTPLPAPMVIIGKSRVLPDHRGEQSSHDFDAINAAAENFARQLLNRPTRAKIKTKVAGAGLAQPRLALGFYSGAQDDEDDAGTAPKKTNMWGWVAAGVGLAVLAALATSHSGGGGGSGTTVTPPPLGSGYAFAGDSYIRLEIPKPSNIDQVQQYQITRTLSISQQAQSPRGRQSTLRAGRDNAPFVFSILHGQEDQVNDTNVFLRDYSSSDHGNIPTPPNMYSYKVTVMYNNGTSQTVSQFFNADVTDMPDLLTAPIGPSVPPPLNVALQSPVITPNNPVVTLTWSVTNISVMPSFVTNWAVERQDPVTRLWSVDNGTLYPISQTSAQVTVPQQGVTYNYRVCAVSRPGYANPYVSATDTQPVAVNLTTYAPNAPTNIQLTQVADTTTTGAMDVQLSWTAPVNSLGTPDTFVSSYAIYRSPGPSKGPRAVQHVTITSPNGGKLPVNLSGRHNRGRVGVTLRGNRILPLSSFTLLTTITDRTVTQYIDTNISDGVTYTYYVAALNTVNSTAVNSDQAAITASFPPGEATGFTATANTPSTGQVTLAWTGPTTKADHTSVLTSAKECDVYYSTSPAAGVTTATSGDLSSSYTKLATVNWGSGTVVGSAMTFSMIDTPAKGKLTSYAVVIIGNDGQSSPGPYLVAQATIATSTTTQTAATFTYFVQSGTERIYYSENPDDQLSDGARTSTPVIIQGWNSSFSGVNFANSATYAVGAKVMVTTDRGYFDITTTDQTVSTDGRSVTGTLDSTGTMTVKFHGRPIPATLIGVITLPGSNELGTPVFTAKDMSVGSSLPVTPGKDNLNNTSATPALIGPPYRIAMQPVVPKDHTQAPDNWPVQTGLWPVTFQVDTTNVTVKVTDLLGQPVMKQMPVWFTQNWAPYNPSASPYDYNGTKGAANIAGAYTGPVSLTDDSGTAQAGFSSNHSGVYTIAAYALMKNFDLTMLNAINTDTVNYAGGATPTALNAVINDAALAAKGAYQTSLLPSAGTVASESTSTLVTASTNVLNKTLAYYDHWQVLSVSDGKTTQDFTTPPSSTACPQIGINCDGTQTARITFTAQDEDGKQVLPSVPFSVQSFLVQGDVTKNYRTITGGLLQLDDNTTVAPTTILSFNSQSQAYVLSRGDSTHPTIGCAVLKFNNLRSVQPTFMPTYLMVIHHGPTMAQATDTLLAPAVSITTPWSTTEGWGARHWIAGASDLVQATTPQSAKVAVMLQDKNVNVFPAGYQVNIIGADGTTFTDYTDNTGHMASGTYTFLGQDLNKFFTTGYPNIIDTHPNPIGAIDQHAPRNLQVQIVGNYDDTYPDPNTTLGNTREDWADQTVVVARPNSFDALTSPTYNPSSPSALGYNNTTTQFSTQVWMKGPNVGTVACKPGYKVSFSIRKTTGGNSAALPDAYTDQNGLVTSVWPSTGTTPDIVYITAFYNANGSGLPGGTNPTSPEYGPVYIGLGTPLNFRATNVTTTAVTLAWNAVPGAAAYNVYENGVQVVTQTAQTSCTISGLTPGQKYNFAVEATAPALLPTIISAQAVLAVQTLFTAPTNITASGITFNSVTLTWDAMAGATGYMVFRSTTNNLASAGAPIASPATNTYTDAAVNPVTKYYYWVESTCAAPIAPATSPSPAGALSSPAAFVVTGLTTPAGTPTAVAGANPGWMSISGWGAVLGATSYYVRYSVDGGVNWSLPINTGSGALNYTVKGLNTGQSYVFDVAAYNSTYGVVSGYTNASAAVTAP